MSFGGHVNDMVHRIKQNATLKNARKRKFKGGNDYSSISRSKTEYDFPTISKTELEKLKTLIQQKANLERIQHYKFITIFILAILLLFAIFNFF